MNMYDIKIETCCLPNTRKIIHDKFRLSYTTSYFSDYESYSKDVVKTFDDLESLCDFLKENYQPFKNTAR